MFIVSTKIAIFDIKDYILNIYYPLYIKFYIFKLNLKTEPDRK